MISIKELKEGNWLIVEYEGQLREGIAIEIDTLDNQVCVETSVQEFWYSTDQLFPIPLNDSVLKKFGFEKEVQIDTSIKYKKGPFRIQIPSIDNFSTIEMWYREDHRIPPNVHYLHQLQNHYHQMTKVDLTMRH